MGGVRQRSQDGFGHAIAFVLVVVFLVLVGLLVADVSGHHNGIDVKGTAAAVGPSVVAVNHQGSGVAISPTEVVTAAHLVDAPEAHTVVSTDKGSATATVVGYDRAADVALLRLDPGAPALTPAGTDDSQTVRAHQSIVVIGNAGATRGTVKSVTNDDVTISAPLRDTAIGGPVVDANHDVVAIARHTNGAATVDALPWNAIVSMIDTVDHGHSTSAVHVGPHASLAVTVTPLNGSSGARVTAVQPGGAAANAGITNGDVIASVRGVMVSSPIDIDAALDPIAPGASVPVAVFDASGTLRNVSVRVGAA